MTRDTLFSWMVCVCVCGGGGGGGGQFGMDVYLATRSTYEKIFCYSKAAVLLPLG